MGWLKDFELYLKLNQSLTYNQPYIMMFWCLCDENVKIHIKIVCDIDIQPITFSLIVTIPRESEKSGRRSDFRYSRCWIKK